MALRGNIYLVDVDVTGWELLLRLALGPSLSSGLEASHGACGEATEGNMLDSYTVVWCVVVCSQASNCRASPEGVQLIPIP